MTTTRRSILHRAALTAAGGILAACRRRQPLAPPVEGRRPDDPAVPRPSPTPLPLPGRYGEAPMLAERVARGELDPVAERLPDEPRVIAPAEGEGRYGGALRRAYAFDGIWGVSPYELAYGATGRELYGLAGADLAAYDEGLTLVPNLCAWWQFDADATRLTVGLRRGLRWSDGTPVTAADAVYHHTHHLPGLGLDREGDPRVEVVDDFTFLLHFSSPRPTYLHGATRTAPGPPLAPAHYLQGYHADLTDGELLGEMARQQGLDDWRALYQEHALAYVNPHLPVLGAWRPAAEAPDPTGEPARERLPWERVQSRGWLRLERNPYYWQVDTAGRQLPYIDRVLHSEVSGRDVLRLRLAGGEIDHQVRGLAAGDLGWLREAEGAGGPTVHLAPTSWHLTLQPNLTARDPRVRAFLGLRGVRIALSLAIDREAIRRDVYDGLGTPRQYSPVAASPLYDPALSEAHIEHDPAEAGRLLDEAGYGRRDGEGYRLHPDGERVSLEIVGLAPEDSPASRAALRAAADLQGVGIDATYRAVSPAEYTSLSMGNLYEAAWVEVGGALLPTVSPGAFVGGRPVEMNKWAGVWALYAVRPEDADEPGSVVEAPPEEHWIRRIWAAARAMEGAPEEWQREAEMREILAIWREELPAIGVLGEAPQPVVLARGLRGWREGLPYDEATGGLALQVLQAFWWEAPEGHGLPEPTPGSGG